MLVLNPERELWGFGLVGVWLGFVAYWLEWHRKPIWVYGVLVAKIGAAWAFGWLYARYYCHGDTLKAYLTAHRLVSYMWEDPLTGLALLFREFSPQWEALGWQVFFRDMQFYGYDYEWSEPSNYHFYRLLVPLYIAAGGSYYGLQGLCGVLGGLLSYAAYRRWEKIYSLPSIFWIFWFLWPSALLWLSGAIRDTFALPATLYLAGWVASFRERRDVWGGIGAGLLLLVLREEALGVGIGVGLVCRWASVWVAGVASLAGLLALQFFLGPWAYQYRLEALDVGMHPELQTSSYFQLKLFSAPDKGWLGWIEALLYGFAGPLPWQIDKGLLLLYAVEVWTGVGLFGYWSRWSFRREGWSFVSLVLVAVGLYIVGVAAMAMPYWGTLARHRLYGMYWVALGVGIAVQKAVQRTQYALSEA
ncbi:MAG: hypothetical protein N2170_00195 [Bacteroidia bacterium]|nr:hypothetical protein [Bacteroidia bacterium]